MTTRTLGTLVFLICGMIVLVGLVSPKPALSESSDGYGTLQSGDRIMVPGARQF